ncbi:hypothetical protein E4U58_001169 [Claviceps cyperi]|nr:hypothetical protein E4U58_001169 [Claviceps cyperi]
MIKASREGGQVGDGDDQEHEYKDKPKDELLGTTAGEGTEDEGSEEEDPSKKLVTEKEMTPNARHFVRHHGGIPRIDEKHYRVSLNGSVARPAEFTLDDLMATSRFARMERTITLQCSGTRRIEQTRKYAGQEDEVPQAPWAEGAIGTASYVGRAVVQDQGERGHARLIYEWDDPSPVPRSTATHCPSFVPRYIGARSVKLAISHQGHFETLGGACSDQRVPLLPAADRQTNTTSGSLTDGFQIQEMPVSSAIMSPWTKQVCVHMGKIRCKGWAYSGGGRWLERVELSADGGFSW